MHRSKRSLTAPVIAIFHLLEKKDSGIEVSETDTHVEQTVVKNFIRCISEVVRLGLHLAKQIESSFCVLIVLAQKLTVPIFI